MKCLRCETEMQDMGSQELQMGHQSALFGGLTQLLSGSLEVRIFRCPACGKLEFFEDQEEQSFSQKLHSQK